MCARTAARLTFAAVFLLAACGQGNRVTSSDGGQTRIQSALGYHVEAYDQPYLDNGGTVTQQHAELADRWWTELMADLRTAGYTDAQTDPSRNVEWVYIYLHKPLDSDSSITCPGRSDLVGACYDQFKPALHVPGDYIKGPMLGRRPAAQALKHEMLHHWCLRTLKSMCLAPGKSEWEGHVWPAPNNPAQNIWDFTWH